MKIRHLILAGLSIVAVSGSTLLAQVSLLGGSYTYTTYPSYNSTPFHNNISGNVHTVTGSFPANAFLGSFFPSPFSFDGGDGTVTGAYKMSASVSGGLQNLGGGAYKVFLEANTGGRVEYHDGGASSSTTTISHYGALFDPNNPNNEMYLDFVLSTDMQVTGEQVWINGADAENGTMDSRSGASIRLIKIAGAPLSGLPHLDWSHPNPPNGSVFAPAGPSILTAGTYRLAGYAIGGVHTAGDTDLSNAATSGGQFHAHFDLAPLVVPEPASLTLFALGAVGMMRRR